MKRIDDWRTAQLKEIEAWADTLDKIITPEKVLPANLHDYPNCRAICEKLRRICIQKEADLCDKVTRIKDTLMDAIERERYVLRVHKATGLPEYKKRYTSVDARERELRKRLREHDTYGDLEQERADWDAMAKDWKIRENELRQEMRVLEQDYMHNGAQVIDRSNHFKLEK